MNLREYDQCMTRDGILWVVHGIFRDAYVCRPKYIPGKTGNFILSGTWYKRLHSPIFRRIKEQKVFSTYDNIPISPQLFKNLYLITEGMIGEVYHSTKEIVARTRTANICNTLVNEIITRAGVQSKDIGVTGSISLGVEKDGIADIDLVLYGYKAFQLFCSFVHSGKSGVSLRRKNEWKDYHTSHGIISKIDRASFSAVMAQRVDQGYYQNIPYTIFVARRKIGTFLVKNGTYSPQQVCGDVGTVTNTMYYPSRIAVSTLGRRVLIESWDRVDKDRWRIGDRLRAVGYGNKDHLIIVPGKGRVERV